MCLFPDFDMSPDGCVRSLNKLSSLSIRLCKDPIPVSFLLEIPVFGPLFSLVGMTMSRHAHSPFQISAPPSTLGSGETQRSFLERTSVMSQSSTHRRSLRKTSRPMESLQAILRGCSSCASMPAASKTYCDFDGGTAQLSRFV